MQKKGISGLLLFLLMVVMCSFLTDPYSHQEKCRVLSDDGSKLLNEFLINKAKNQYNARHQVVAEALQSQEGIETYIRRITSNYDELLNLDFPKTPLNAEITGEIECENYKIEKVIFESHPNHHVTGNLYIPTFKEGPFPAVLEVCGHSMNGKALEAYQKVATLFVQNGFVVFLIDTYGQGEMYQIQDVENSIVNLDKSFGTITHNQLDIGSMLIGTDVVTYQVWNNIRAIDYLCSRPEVDKDKIGVTGNSGGGTQTLYLAGLDSRIKVAAPSCGMQTRERMFTLNGPADGCHHLAGEGLRMLEYSDYLILSAPKPILVLAGETDGLFDINAVSQTVREAKWFYKELGFLDRVDLFTVNDGHGYHKGLREAAVWWFKKWLLNDESPVVEQELVIQKDKDLQVTKSGQVLIEYNNGKSIIDLNIQAANKYKQQRTNFWKHNTSDVCLSEVKELIGYEDKIGDKKIGIIEVGETDKIDFIEKEIIITGRDGFPLPGLLYIPKKVNNSYPVTLYIDSRGKNRISDVEIAKLLEGGRIVFSLDIRGFGETKDDPGELRQSWRSWNDEHRIAQTSFHIGKPLIGQRVQDVIDALDYLFSLPGINTNDIELVGYGKCGLVALHAAAIDTRISEVKIIQSVSTWMDIIKDPLAKDHLSNVVPRAMQYYDLPNLVNVIKPRMVEFAKNVN